MDQIKQDVPKLKADNDTGIYRPTVMHFTDGEPNDNEVLREQAWEDLTDPDFPLHPNFFTFGVGEAERDAIKDYKSGHGRVFIQREDSNIAESIKEIIVLLVHSIVSSGLNPNQGAGGQIIIDPDDIAGLNAIELID